MRRTTIQSRLILSFLAVALVGGAVGVAAILGMRYVNRNLESVSRVGEKTISGVYLLTNITEQRAAYRGAALKQMLDMPAEAEADLRILRELDGEFQRMVQAAADTLTVPIEHTMLQAVSDTYATYRTERDICVAFIEANAPKEELVPALLSLTDPIIQAIDAVEALVSYGREKNAEMAIQSRQAVNSRTIVLAAIISVLLICSITLGMRTSLKISRPVKELAKASGQLALGNVGVSLSIQQRDEIGQLAAAFREMSMGIREQADILTSIADGNYTATASVRSDQDIINQAINRLIRQNSELLSCIDISANQVNAAIRQITQSAQNLSVGASEQASSVQDFNASIVDIREKFEENSQISSSALKNVEKTRRMMEESNQSMGQVLEAMKAIQDSSRSISSVISVIDDISFQTKILSLNAAVEAARAGVHGKGFAVVADEVRTLAAKSAQAAQETAALIDADAKTIEQGNNLVQTTIHSLKKINEISASNANDIEKISQVSMEQSTVMDEIAQNIFQIANVVQATSASAEEIASASEEILAQTANLSNLTSQFQLSGRTLGQGEGGMAMSVGLTRR